MNEFGNKDNKLVKYDSLFCDPINGDAQGSDSQYYKYSKKLTEYDCFECKLTQHFRYGVSAIQKRLQHV